MGVSREDYDAAWNLTPSMQNSSPPMARKEIWLKIHPKWRDKIPILVQNVSTQMEDVMSGGKIPGKGQIREQK